MSDKRKSSFRWTRNRNTKTALDVDEFLPSEDLNSTPRKNSTNSITSKTETNSRNSSSSSSSSPLTTTTNNNNNNSFSKKYNKNNINNNTTKQKPLPKTPNSLNEKPHPSNNSQENKSSFDLNEKEEEIKTKNDNNSNSNNNNNNNTSNSNISQEQKRISDLESKIKLLTIENTQLQQDLKQVHQLIGENNAREESNDTNNHSSNNNNNNNDNNDFDVSDEITDSTLKAIQLLSSRTHIHLPSKQQETRVFQGIRELRSIRTLRQMKDALELSYTAGDTDLMGFILLHMKGNLNEKIFFSVLAQNRFALKIYINIQKQRKSFGELQRLYRFMDMPEESVMLSLYRAFDMVSPSDATEEDPDISPEKGLELLNELKRILPVIRHRPNLSHFVEPVQKQITLLENQIQIERFDAKAEAAGRDPMYLEHPRFNIVNKPIGTTLYYCLFYHPYVGKDKISSPARMRNQFNVSERRWEWTALRARARLGDWDAVKKIPNIKVGGIFSRNTVKSPLSMSSYVDIVFEYNGPEELAMYFLKLIKHKETKLATAMKYNMYQIAIDTIIEMKNRERMVDLRQYLLDALPPEKNEHFLHQIDQALTSSKIKWKKHRFSIFN